MQSSNNHITFIFLVTTTLIILLLAVFIVTLIYLYQKKQIAYQEKMDAMKLDHEKNLMAAQLEMQENTFQHISREIHDNISLSLTLVKLHLNTMNLDNREKSLMQVEHSIELLSQSITDLSDVSKSLNSDIITSHGLVKALDSEIRRIQSTGLFTIHFSMEGDPVYMEIKKELIIFRIIQEAFNNIIRHANAADVLLTLKYCRDNLIILISDDGKGFVLPSNHNKLNGKAGLRNMSIRTEMINGMMHIESTEQKGTLLEFTIPL